jgi:hypothetical protein
VNRKKKMEVDEGLNQEQDQHVQDPVVEEALAPFVELDSNLNEEETAVAVVSEQQPSLLEEEQHVADEQQEKEQQQQPIESLDEQLTSQIAALTATESTGTLTTTVESSSQELETQPEVEEEAANNESMNLDDATCKSANTKKSADADNDDELEPDLDGVGDELEDMDQSDSLLKDLDLTPGGTSMSASAQAAADSGNNVYTFRKTEWDVKKMENYVKLVFSESIAMEKLDPVTLNSYLKSFFEHAKKSDGMDYEPESLIGFMNSYERYLKTKNYPESLLRSDAFKESRTILKNKRELVRSIGKLIRTKSKDTCYVLQYNRNLLKEKGLLSRDNPDGLLAEVKTFFFLNKNVFLFYVYLTFAVSLILFIS